MTEWEDLKKTWGGVWDEIRANCVVTLLEIAQCIAPDNDFGMRLQKTLLKWSADEVRIAQEEKHNAG